MTMLAIESQQVICLRTIKMAAGGKKAHREAHLMVTEGLVLPDNDIGLSSTVNDIVDLIAERLRGQDAPLALPQVIKAAGETVSEVGQAEVLISADQAPSIAEFKDTRDMLHLVPKAE